MEVIYNDLKRNPSSNSISYKRLNKPKVTTNKGWSKHGANLSPKVTHKQ
jgi:hypothetical protein